jgi:hypothetical protein
MGRLSFSSPVVVPSINNLGAVNTLISSTPATSTNISFIINRLQTSIKFRTIGFLQRRVLARPV